MFVCDRLCAGAAPQIPVVWQKICDNDRISTLSLNFNELHTYAFIYTCGIPQNSALVLPFWNIQDFPSITSRGGPIQIIHRKLAGRCEIISKSFSKCLSTTASSSSEGMDLCSSQAGSLPTSSMPVCSTMAACFPSYRMHTQKLSWIL